jgi:hypothetical protein
MQKKTMMHQKNVTVNKETNTAKKQNNVSIVEASDEHASNNSPDIEIQTEVFPMVL